MTTKIWKVGDFVSFEVLNALQEKADKYDELLAEKEKSAKQKKETKKK